MNKRFITMLIENGAADNAIKEFIRMQSEPHNGGRVILKYYEITSYFACVYVPENEENKTGEILYEEDAVNESEAIPSVFNYWSEENPDTEIKDVSGYWIAPEDGYIERDKYRIPIYEGQTIKNARNCWMIAKVNSKIDSFRTKLINAIKEK